jgi:beta-N-acetylhexosaminidase
LLSICGVWFGFSRGNDTSPGPSLVVTSAPGPSSPATSLDVGDYPKGTLRSVAHDSSGRIDPVLPGVLIKTEPTKAFQYAEEPSTTETTAPQSVERSNTAETTAPQSVEHSGTAETTAPQSVENSRTSEPTGTAQTVGAEKPSLDRMIGQMIVVGFIGTVSDDSGVVAVRKELKNGAIGGVMLLTRNVKSPQQVRELNDSIIQAAGSATPLISVDEEGGEVQRLTPRNGHRMFPSAEQVSKGAGGDQGGRAVLLYSKMAAELRADGFNVNFGPDVDLNRNPSNPIIGRLGRSFGTDPKVVTDFARWFILAHHQDNILTAAKHFPGHGSSRTDSHLTFTDISQTWDEVELKPFENLAKDNSVDMIMIGHLYHPMFSDGPGIPASLSKKAVSYLRTDIGFKGVIVSDDMEMGALRNNFSFKDIIVRAVAAGTDILVFANRVAPQDDLGARVHAVILAAVQNGTIPEARIEEAFTRIVNMKSNLKKERSAQLAKP